MHIFSVIINYISHLSSMVYQRASRATILIKTFKITEITIKVKS